LLDRCRALLPRVFRDHEAIGLARLQNDLLIALTARHTGTLLVTSDRHFTALRRHVPFTVKVCRRASRPVRLPRAASAKNAHLHRLGSFPVRADCSSGAYDVPSAGVITEIATGEPLSFAGRVVVFAAAMDAASGSAWGLMANLP